MDSNYYKKCSRCDEFKEVLSFFKESGKETRMCESCREIVRKYVNTRNEKLKKSKDQECDHCPSSRSEIKQRLDELIPLINELREML